MSRVYSCDKCNNKIKLNYHTLKCDNFEFDLCNICWKEFKKWIFNPPNQIPHIEENIVEGLVKKKFGAKYK